MTISPPLTPCGGSGSAGSTAELGTWLGDLARRLEGVEEKSQTPSAFAFTQRLRLKRQGDSLIRSKIKRHGLMTGDAVVWRAEASLVI